MDAKAQEALLLLRVVPRNNMRKGKGVEYGKSRTECRRRYIELVKEEARWVFTGDGEMWNIGQCRAMLQPLLSKVCIGILGEVFLKRLFDSH